MILITIVIIVALCVVIGILYVDSKESKKINENQRLRIEHLEMERKRVEGSNTSLLVSLDESDKIIKKLVYSLKYIDASCKNISAFDLIKNRKELPTLMLKLNPISKRIKARTIGKNNKEVTGIHIELESGDFIHPTINELLTSLNL